MENQCSYSLSKKYFAIFPSDGQKSKAKQEYLNRVGFYEDVSNKYIARGRIEPGAIETNIANTNEVRFEVTENCNLSCKYLFKFYYFT